MTKKYVFVIHDKRKNINLFALFIDDFSCQLGDIEVLEIAKKIKNNWSKHEIEYAEFPGYPGIYFNRKKVEFSDEELIQYFNRDAIIKEIIDVSHLSNSVILNMYPAI